MTYSQDDLLRVISKYAEDLSITFERLEWEITQILIRSDAYSPSPQADFMLHFAKYSRGVGEEMKNAANIVKQWI